MVPVAVDERARRLWSGTEAGAIGWGGVASVARATGMAISTVRKGRDEAREIFITADAGGSNSYRSHVWKHQLQRVADKLDMSIHVSHFPPGTSKWNKVEHRLFSFILINWRGRPLRDLRDRHQPHWQHDQPGLPH